MKPRSHSLTNRRYIGFLSAFVFACLVMMISSRAATIFVDAQLPTASCANYNPATRACGAGVNQAYKTIAGAAGVASAGTVVLIRGGSYAEQLVPASSGVAGSPITFQSYPGESVYLTGATAIYLVNRSHIIVDGIHAEDTRWLEANNSHYNVIRNCVFKRTPASGTTGNVRFIRSHYNRVQNNWIESGQDNVVLIDANYNVVEGNTFREGRHSLLSIRCGDYNVVRSNYFANTLQKIAEIYDCGADTTAVPNSFNSTKHNLFEGNVFADASSYYSTSGGTGLQYSGQEGIVRGNVFYNCNVGFSIAVYADEGLYVNDNNIYNNVFYANDGAAISMGSAPRNTFKNNVLFGNLGVLPDCFAVSPGQIAYRTSFGSGTRYENNDILHQTAGQPVIEIEFGYGQSIAQFNASNPGIFYNAFEVDPQFVNVPARDFRLQSTSPLINAGAFVTQASAAGSGTVLPVLNASAFYDGHGIPGETGDVIRLQGQPQTARIVSIDHINKRLILDQPLSWLAGQGVSLNYSGTAPDIGAHEYIESNQPPRVPSVATMRISLNGGASWFVRTDGNDDGSILFNGSLGPAGNRWTLSGLTASTMRSTGTSGDPLLNGSAADPVMNLSLGSVTSDNAGVLLIEFSQTYYGPINSGNTFATSLSSENVGEGSTTVWSYLSPRNSGNNLFDKQTLLGDITLTGQGTSSSDSSGQMLLGDNVHFSLTTRILVHHDRAGTSSFGDRLVCLAPLPQL